MSPAPKLRVLDGGLTDDQTLHERIREAMASVQVVFQPIVWAQCPVVFGHEALVRCEASSIGGPSDLFAAAERAGMVIEVEREIRAEIASALHRLPEQTQVFVNVHPDALEDEELYDPSSPLAAHADRVAIEITERAALEHIDTLADKLAALRRLGYAIAIDGLGADLQALCTFAELNPDLVKFDMGLIRDVDSQPVHAQLLEAMVAMSRDLRIRTVGVGVETNAEREFLRELGCDLLQGFRFAHPDWPPAEIAW